MKPIPRQTQTASAEARDRGRVLIIAEEPAVAYQETLEAAGLEIALLEDAVGSADVG